MPNEKEPNDLLTWLGIAEAPNWRVSRLLGHLAGTLIAVLVPLLFFGALLTACVVLYQALAGAAGGTSFGAGALVAALLGAPFVAWATWLRHRALSFQKEGHITDRINKAVEMLGAEKTVSRLMRQVSYILDGERQSWFEGREKPYEVPGGATEVARGHWQVVSRTEPNIEVRIGAILSLERIAQDSTAYDRGRDHVRVMEILCAYLRENSPASGARNFPLPGWQPLPKWEPLPETASAHDREEHETARKAQVKQHEEWSLVRFSQKIQDGILVSAGPLTLHWAKTLKPPRADVALAVSVIGRRSAAQRRVEAAWPDPPGQGTVWPFDTPCPELPETSGKNALPEADLRTYPDQLRTWKIQIGSYRGYRPDLRGTNLQRADLSGLCFSGAQMNAARLEGAYLRDARMEGTNLSEAHIEGADVTAAHLEGANLQVARLEGAMLLWARLLGANLNAARFESAALLWAQLVGANLSHGRLEKADLRAAWMEGADLSGTRMDGADLREARMDSRTSLAGATLRGAAARDVDWAAVPIGQDQIASMFGDASVILPEGLTRPGHWPDWALPLYEHDNPNDFDTQWRLWRSDPAAYRPPPRS